MLIRAENDPRFSRKFLFMGILAIGFAFYCLYDGIVGYPAQRVRGFDEFKDEFKKSLFADSNDRKISLAEFEVQADEDRRAKWAQYSHEREIPAHANIVMQFIMAAITGATGLFLVSIPLRAR